MKTRVCRRNVADAVKLMFKEIIVPAAANKGLFFLGPVMTIMPALAAWAVVPFGPDVVLANINAGLLFLMAITSIEVYGVIIAGWASNSKYAFLSAIRSAAQMVSYEVSIGFVIITVLLCAGSLNITATNASPFAINLTSLTAGNAAGNVINFNSASNYSYTIATASGGISGFGTDKFTLNTSGFSNALDGGTWSLAQSGNNLNLNYTASAIPEPSTYAAILGAAALAGWLSGHRELASFGTQYNPTAPSTAVLLLVLFKTVEPQSWRVAILPYLEQDNFYRQWNVNTTYYDQIPAARQYNVKGYFCPSRRTSSCG
mgnify:CR=1 FL=1